MMFMKTISCTRNKTSVMMGFYKRTLSCFDVLYWFFQCHCIVIIKLVQSWILWIPKGHFLFLWRLHYLLTYMNTFLLVWDCLPSHHSHFSNYIPLSAHMTLKSVQCFFSWTERDKNFHKVCDLVNQPVGWTRKTLLCEAFQEICTC